MNNAIILQGVIVLVFGAGVFFVRARQARREMDETMAAQHAALVASNSNNTVTEFDEETKGPQSIMMVGLDQKPDVGSGPGQKIDLYERDA